MPDSTVSIIIAGVSAFGAVFGIIWKVYTVLADRIGKNMTEITRQSERAHDSTIAHAGALHTRINNMLQDIVALKTSSIANDRRDIDTSRRLEQIEDEAKLLNYELENIKRELIANKNRGAR